MTSDQRKRFCSRPFEWFEIQGNEAYLCCSGWITLKGIDVRHRRVEEIWNGREAEEFRASILDGSFRYCQADKCPFMNQDDVPTWEKKGQPYRWRHEVSDPRLTQIIAERKTVLEDGPLVLNCGYDNTCNLYCPTCRKAIQALDADQRESALALQERIFAEVGRKLEVLYVTGTGDPFVSQVYRTLLGRLSAEEFPKLEIHLNTNANLWTRENWAAWHKLHKNITSAHISVDASCGGTYALNRRGGNWNRLMENLSFVAGLRRDGPLRFVTLSFVVQENNYREMPDFVAMTERFGFDMVYFHKLQNWGSYDYREYNRRAIHLALHPEHHKFLEILSNPCFNKPFIGLFCLFPLRQKALVVKDRPGGFWRLGLQNALIRFFLLFPRLARKLKREAVRLFNKENHREEVPA